VFFQRRIVRSSPDDAIVFPSIENSTSKIAPLCPRNLKGRCSVLKLQTWTAESSEPEETCFL